jgi:hypothetical protein
MQVEINTKIKVFPKLYVGLKAQTQVDPVTKERVPRVNLGFATPLENNAAFEKRKRTVDDWSKPWADWDPITRKSIPRPPLDPITIDNVPVAGFKVTDDVRRIYWGGGNVVWRVEDPRGFELEVSSQNLMAVIQTVGLAAGGEIPGKCVWARDGANNVLLHETTQEFKNAYRVGETVSTKGTKLKPEHIGCKVSFKSGYTGTYLGAGSCFSWSKYGEDRVFSETFNHYFLNADDKGLTAYRDPKPLLIEDYRKISDEDALATINRLRQDTHYAGYNGGFGLRYTKIVRAKKAKSLKLTLKPISVEEAAKHLELRLTYHYANVEPKTNTIVLGVKGDELFSLYTNQYHSGMAFYPRYDSFKVSFDSVAIEGGRIRQVGKVTHGGTLGGVPKDQYSAEAKAWAEATLPKVLRSFDSLVRVEPVIEY